MPIERLARRRSATARPPRGPMLRRRQDRNIDLLLDVELQVALRFGKREMQLGDILELSAGAVVELDQKILEPVELLVGGKVVAHGEVVVLDGHYALRVTEVLNPVERIESLTAVRLGSRCQRRSTSEHRRPLSQSTISNLQSRSIC